MNSQISINNSSDNNFSILNRFYKNLYIDNLESFALKKNNNYYTLENILFSCNKSSSKFSIDKESEFNFSSSENFSQSSSSNNSNYIYSPYRPYYNKYYIPKKSKFYNKPNYNKIEKISNNNSSFNSKTDKIRVNEKLWNEIKESKDNFMNDSLDSNFDSLNSSFKNLNLNIINKDEIEKKINEGNNECTICLEKFENNEIINVLKKCKHYYHEICLKEWLKKISKDSKFCPICKEIISIK